ncbi:conserved hypothetical protein [Methanohalobium evestigatum Z-7303]|uniref:Uncharacterized protein n=1 Tax=Methanohalobium evestigatum (strain ATCC BAA-1072 / DSM 3721 / NBRC 107634 / OCM 161 / Z-7303) TaxID=644295 RepID=D7EAA7_METEZ|nr:hypothetical protein [Methanohalobium evestigatum]ADI74778.1 conserved hypothetical protein [Methanohalobium evestigatum Z-7303]
MAKRPFKFRLLELCTDEEPHWNNDLVNQVAKEYDSENNKFMKETLNFDLIELAAYGFLQDIEQKIDDEGVWLKGALLHKYVITDYGKARAQDACLGPDIGLKKKREAGEI